jgi:hypothetical protein
MLLAGLRSILLRMESLNMLTRELKLIPAAVGI